MVVHPIHPFPARMAPEIALEEIQALPSNTLVLDPMVGSGTVMRVAAEYGCRGVGFDLDPLAVLISKVWTAKIDPAEITNSAEQLLDYASSINRDSIYLPWIDDNAETKDFIDYWFGDIQKRDLRVLSYLLHGIEGPAFDALRVAFSRLIITKDRGASLARDVSHSRPHRVMLESSFDVMSEFQKSVFRLAKVINAHSLKGQVSIQLGDARNMVVMPDDSVDAVITSPPYLNAIDYMRGHRLSLVWFGHTVSELRNIRGVSIGAEKAPDFNTDSNYFERYRTLMGNIDELSSAQGKMIDRFVIDMYALLKEIKRLVRTGGKVIMVVGNTCLKSVFIDNAMAVATIAEELGLELLQRRERELPPAHRYLPPPAQGRESDLQKRLRTETVLTIRR